MKTNGWIGVDLDGTLAYDEPNEKFDKDHIGDPVPEMLERVKEWLKGGKEVKIFTARVGTGRGLSPTSGYEDTQAFADEQREMIQDWTEEHLGARLEVTAQKDWATIEIWDDRAIQVIRNKGRTIEEAWKYLFKYIYVRLGGMSL